jgi:uncharacterized membrane protein YgcG
MELLLFGAMAWFAWMFIRLGIHLWGKEQAARNALAKKIADDAKALTSETEAWLEAQWRKRFGKS